MWRGVAGCGMCVCLVKYQWTEIDRQRELFPVVAPSSTAITPAINLVCSVALWYWSQNSSATYRKEHTWTPTSLFPRSTQTSDPPLKAQYGKLKRHDCKRFWAARTTSSSCSLQKLTVRSTTSVPCSWSRKWYQSHGSIFAVDFSWNGHILKFKEL